MNETLHVDPWNIKSTILKDHVPLKKLLDNLKDTRSKRAEKEAWLKEFVTMLMGHGKAEELRPCTTMKKYDMLKLEFYQDDSEHALAEQLIHAVNNTPNDAEWIAKVSVLTEMVESHILEEETEILGMVRQEIELAARIEIGDEYTKLSQDYNHLNSRHSFLNENYKDIFTNNSP